MHTVFDLSQTSPAVASAVTVGTVTPITGLDEFNWITAIIEMAGATGGTTNIVLQTSEDGSTWYDWFRSADIAAAAAASILTVTAKQGDGTPVVCGKGVVPALAKGTVRPGNWQSRMRAVFETGAGVTVGAAQIIKVYGYRPSG